MVLARTHVMKYKLSNKEKINPVEPPCRKRIYDSKEDAMEAISFVTSTRRVMLEAYQCSVCGFWHLTSVNSQKRQQ